ncbi:hypothetical protein Trydic_g7968 [Trypoxylus dichotomus]
MLTRSLGTSTQNIVRQHQLDKTQDENKHPFVSYDVGDHLKLRTFLRQIGKGDKLQAKYFGPYTTTEEDNELNYVVIALCGIKENEDTVHTSRLAPYHVSWNSSFENYVNVHGLFEN